MSNYRQPCNTPVIISKRKSSTEQELYHGHVFSPASRAYFAREDGIINEGELNQCEAGKFFPLLEAGLKDPYAPDDVENLLPPPDGRLASANQPGTGMASLDAPGTHWRKHDVSSGGVLPISWSFTANHTTRRWKYFLTKPGWDPQKPLSRAQFEPEPFAVDQLNLKPFWEHTNALKPPTPYNYALSLPQREGYHVLLAVWEVADTGNAFYQVIDLNFISDGGGNERPSIPSGLSVTGTTANSVSLSWNANPSTDPYPVTTYRIWRNGVTSVDIDAPVLNWNDLSVEPDTSYSYFITAIDSQGQISLPGSTVTVTTPVEGGEDAPPGAPKNLHSMKETARTIALMWGASSSVNPITLYHIYRDGDEVASTASTSWEDSGLTPLTRYQYFVAAEDDKGHSSVPGNILLVSTKANEGGGQDEWKLNTRYEVNDVVTYKGNSYACFQAHTSIQDWNPEATTNILWLINTN